MADVEVWGVINLKLYVKISKQTGDIKFNVRN